jgi:hypothetical protein
MNSNSGDLSGNFKVTVPIQTDVSYNDTSEHGYSLILTLSNIGQMQIA